MTMIFSIMRATTIIIIITITTTMNIIILRLIPLSSVSLT